jgi:hypothetical protein
VDESTIGANAKHHIVNHLVRDAVVWDVRFQDGHVANSDTKTQPWHSDRIVLIQFRGLSATRKLWQKSRWVLVNAEIAEVL